MRRTLVGAVVATTAIGLTITTTAVAAPDRDGLTKAQRDALDVGLQVAPKTVGSQAKAAPGPNPYLANLPSLEDADYFRWNKQMRAAAERRADTAALRANRRAATRDMTGVAPAPPFVHDEEEPAGSAGSNDTWENAEPIPQFGTNRNRNNRLRILGELADLPGATPEDVEVTEDNGAIPLATDTGIEGSGAATTDSVLGDGPHGSETGDGSNDFEFFSMEVGAGQSILASTLGGPSGTDTVLAVYDADGTTLAAADDSAGTLQSELTYTPEEPGTYYLLVAGYDFFGPLPNDPFDSGSGNGGADEGGYTLDLSVQQIDRDFYSVRLRPGDTVGAVGNGAAQTLAVTTPSGEERVGGTNTDASSLYPPTSPLPGGGNTTVSYVAEEAGWYAVEVAGGTGDYDVTVEAYRPGAEVDETRRTQTVLLDFDPGRVNAGTWGGPGVREVSPFSAFVPRWGIPRASARQVERQVLQEVRANLRREVQAGGLNPDVNVDVLDARNHQNLIGKENVSRIYVAGTIDETGIPTIGIAQYIDPGNFGHEDEAIVLLDVLSEPAGPVSSLNTFIGASSDRVAFVSQAVGNVTAHEVGHTIGNYHTDNANDVHNVMDSGGANFADNLYGVGPDGIGGTADDENIGFRTDTYSPVEGFTGLEDTLNVTAWAYSGR
ncbi:pre-peptidase C-terminal domain-containing protein [Nocardioides sp. GXQ0305]|uniref:pre-peptidase C-terminal domain-containing protein n=1 Tax=Nocardioides sp. GXQ0305 TaxID=3423912 RepID=UPI003D7D5E81